MFKIEMVVSSADTLVEVLRAAAQDVVALKVERVREQTEIVTPEQFVSQDVPEKDYPENYRKKGLKKKIMDILEQGGKYSYAQLREAARKHGYVERSISPLVQGLYTTGVVERRGGMVWLKKLELPQ